MRIGRIRVIFKLPTALSLLTPAPISWPTEPLAYIEWYRLSSRPGKYHNMYTVSKLAPIHISANFPSVVQGDIVSIKTIRQSCQLIPIISDHDHDSSNTLHKSNWTSKNILDNCSSFLLNNWSSKYAYQTLY